MQEVDWKKVSDALEAAVVPRGGSASGAAAISGKVAPGAVLLVSQDGEELFHEAFGCRSILPEKTLLSKDMVFDVASLTKAIVTTTLMMQLVERKQINLDRRVSTILQTFGTHGKERITVRHLLNHSSGFPAYLPLYKRVSQADNMGRMGMTTSRGAYDLVLQETYRASLENLPGKVGKYSDLGFILLGQIVETLSGSGVRLDRLATKQIFQPLGMKSTGYVDLVRHKARGIEPVHDIIVPTAECPWRGRMMCGEVHDENCWAMGGVAGHAGLFSTAEDINRFATELVRCFHGQSDFLSPDVVREFWTLTDAVPGSTWTLGWDTPTPGASSSGKYLSAHSVGHLGFTGCSLWIDLERKIVITLLSNRVHPSAENNLIKGFRPAIHDLVMEVLGYGV